jgi:hypothetical protein
MRNKESVQITTSLKTTAELAILAILSVLNKLKLVQAKLHTYFSQKLKADKLKAKVLIKDGIKPV